MKHRLGTILGTKKNAESTASCSDTRIVDARFENVDFPERAWARVGHVEYHEHPVTCYPVGTVLRNEDGYETRVIHDTDEYTNRWQSVGHVVIHSERPEVGSCWIGRQTGADIVVVFSDNKSVVYEYTSSNGNMSLTGKRLISSVKQFQSDFEAQ